MSTLHRGGKGQNAGRANFSNPSDQGCSLPISVPSIAIRIHLKTTLTVLQRKHIVYIYALVHTFVISQVRLCLTTLDNNKFFFCRLAHVTIAETGKAEMPPTA